MIATSGRTQGPLPNIRATGDPQIAPEQNRLTRSPSWAGSASVEKFWKADEGTGGRGSGDQQSESLFSFLRFYPEFSLRPTLLIPS